MDPRIEGQYAPGAATRAAILAMKCLMKEPQHRPSADEVVKALEQLQELQKASESLRAETAQKDKDNEKDDKVVSSYPRPLASSSGSSGGG